jgi:hypothetical protein
LRSGAVSLATESRTPRLRSRSSAARVGELARRQTGKDLGLALALGAALCALAFVTTGGTTDGTNLAPNTWAQIVLVLIAAVFGLAAVALCARARAWGAVSLGLFAALAAVNLLSISWSVQPANSWLDTNLTLSYVAAFAGGLALARIAPERWAAIIGAVVVLTVVVSGYSVLAKVFPATIDPGQTLFGARLSAPFGYWNAVGLMAGIGLPACVWLGARHGGRPVLRALSVPAIGVLVTAILLSYSRGALVAAAIGLACWFILVPLRLRGSLVLALGAAAGGAVMLWALATPAITTSGQTLQARIAAGHAFGLVLVVMLAASLVVGLAAAFASDRFELSARDRRRVGKALLALLACVPVVAVLALSLSSRGFTGEVSHAWSQVTGTNTGTVAPSQGASRLLQAGNLHAAYWSEGVKVGEHALLKGAGAGGFGTASPRYSRGQDVAAHAHSYVIETFADLGLIGLAVTLALLVAWSAAVGRAVGLRLRWGSRGSSGEGGDPVPERAAERAGLLTLLAVVVIFGAHSLIDWTWFIPGLAVPALVCAGWLAGRGPLAHPVGRAPRRERARLEPLGESPPPPRQPRGSLGHALASGLRAAITAGHRGVTAAPGQVAAVAAIAAIALVCAWTIWQPLRSSDADAAALAALSANHPAAALADVRSAAAIDPYSTEPLLYESDIYSALGDTAAARAALVADVALQPANYKTWFQLGQYDVEVGRWRDAIAAAQGALRLFPHNLIAANLLSGARAHR